MAKVRMLRDLVGLYNGQHVYAGDIIDIPAHKAEMMCARGDCEPANASVKQPVEKRSMADSKTELLEAAEGLDVDESNTKAEILEALEND